VSKFIARFLGIVGWSENFTSKSPAWKTKHREHREKLERTETSRQLKEKSLCSQVFLCLLCVKSFLSQLASASRSPREDFTKVPRPAARLSRIIPWR
jgi:hypothetical protein